MSKATKKTTTKTAATKTNNSKKEKAVSKKKTATTKKTAPKKTAAKKAPAKKTEAKKEKANRAARPVSDAAKKNLTAAKKAKDKQGFLSGLTRQDVKDLIKLSGAMDGKCGAGKGKDELVGVLVVFLKG